MPPMMTIRPSASRGFVTLGGTLTEPIHAQLREWPGAVCRYHGGTYVWECPSEFAGKLRSLATRCDIYTDYPQDLATPPPLDETSAYPYQLDAVSKALTEQSFMLNFEMGCISGDAIVHINRAKKGYSISLGDLWSKFNGHASVKWKRHIPTYIRSLCGDELRLNEVKKVLYQGVKAVWKLSTVQGKTLRLTSDHEVATPKGFVEAKWLCPGTKILCNGKWVDKDGYVRVGGLKHKHHRWTTGGVYEHILVAEKHLGRRLKPGEHVHHINGIKTDNVWENFKILTHSEHMRLHGKEGGYRRLRPYFTPHVDVVKSIEPDGFTDVFDVVCADPHRNFVANGIVVHNCGKTLAAILALKELEKSKAPRILVICPAMVRQVWVNEIAKWWPRKSIGGPFVLEPGLKFGPGEQLNFDGCGIWITSYELLKKVPLGYWDAIVIDECHMIAGGGYTADGHARGAQRATLCHAFRKANPKSFRLALTATPVFTEPKQIHSQWEWLFPARLGSWTAFTNRYCNVVDTGWTTASGNKANKVFGVNKEHEAELRDRLSYGMSRVTKKEVAHLLPPFICQTLRVDRPRGFNPRELVDRFLRSDLHRVDSEEFIRMHSLNKVSVVANEASNALASTPRVMVLTYLHKTAHLIAAELAKAGAPVTTVTGEQTTKQRHEAIKAATAKRSAVVVASMASVAVGIDLTAFTVVYFAELYPSPGLMEQVTGRFHRLNSQEPVTVYWVIINGSYEEKVAASLTKRLADQKGIIAESMTAGAISDSFADKRSDEEFRDHLNSLLGSVHSDAELGGYL